MRKMFTRFLVLLLALVLTLPCVSFSEGERKIVMGYAESDPYVEFDTQLYYLLMGMEEYGLISGVSDKLESDMTASELCDLLVATFTGGEFSYDGLTGAGMTWDETGAVTKAPKGVVIENGVYVGLD